MQKYKIDSARIEPAQLPEFLRRKQDEKRDRRTGEVFFQFGLQQQVSLLDHLDPQDPLVAVHGEWGPEWLSRRNHSVLAHGYTAVNQAAAKAAMDWVREKLVLPGHVDRAVALPVSPEAD